MLVVGTVQTIVRRLKVMTRPDLIVVDEAHHARANTWVVVLGYWAKTYLLGLTATPERLDRKGLKPHFKKMVCGPSIPDCSKMAGSLPARHCVCPRNSGSTWPGFAGSSSTRDYAVRDVSARVTEKVIASAAKSYLRYASGRRALFSA